MKNLRQLLRRPVRKCESEIRGELDGDDYLIYTTCTHLKKPRITRHVGAAHNEEWRREAWEDARKDVDTHIKYSDPW